MIKRKAVRDLLGSLAVLLVLTPVRSFGGPILTFLELQRDGSGGVDGLNGAYSVAVSPDGKHVYVAGYDDDAVAAFERNSATGLLTYVERERDGLNGVNGLNGASSVAVSPDGAHVYVTGFIDDAVSVFQRDSVTGALTFLEMHRDGIGGVDGLDGATAVALSSDGANVYVAGYVEDAVAVFGRNLSTGALTYVEAHRDGIGGVNGLNGVRSVTVSADGAHLYAAGRFDDAVALFDRDAGTGALTYVESVTDGVNGVDGLNGAYHLALSPDGKQLYAASFDEDAVAVFSRDTLSGTLTFVEELVDGAAGGTRLNGASGVAASPDGAHVYATSYYDDALTVFERNIATGALTYAEVHIDNVAGVNGLNAANSVAVSPNGAHVYATGLADDAVAYFESLCGNGTLDPGEGCDQPGEQGTCSPGDVCTDDCTACVLAGCGNGATETGAGEECDDGGESAACDADCTLAICGDGTLNGTAGESCDDSNLVDGDGCDSNCLPTGCGNGIVTAGEECDDAGESAACDLDCTLAACGDGTLNTSAGEVCDDGNLVDGDGCDSNCEPTGCGNGIVTAGEDCDDAGESATCDLDCTFASCGDGTTNASADEECDDGNAVPADGCEPDCTISCPESVANCLGVADDFALVAERLKTRPGPLKFLGDIYNFNTRIEGSVCIENGKFAGALDAETTIDGDLILLDDSGTAARFKGVRDVTGLSPGTEIAGDLITGGGSIKGLEYAVVDGVVDTTGTHPKLDVCRQAFIDMRAASDLLRDLPTTQDLGRVIVNGGDEYYLDAYSTPGLNVFEFSGIFLRTDNQSYSGYAYFQGARFIVEQDFPSNSVVLNISTALSLLKESFMYSDGDESRVILNVYGDRPRVKLAKWVAEIETHTQFPILAPRGILKADRNSTVCGGIFASKVTLKGASVYDYAGCN